jgi:hypothetical protein
VCHGAASAAFQQLQTCACASNCTMECDPTLCFGNLPDNVCQACLSSSCNDALRTCQAM